MTQVNLKISPEMKDRWDEHADLEWAGNLSAMIRQAVEREIAGGNDPGAVDADVDLDPVIERLDDIAGAVERVEDRMGLLEADEDVDRVAGRVSEWLPVGRPGEGPWEDALADIRTGDVPGPIPSDDPVVAELAWQGTTGGLAQVSGYPESLVAEALAKLERDIHIVHSTEFAGATRYYKTEARW